MIRVLHIEDRRENRLLVRKLLEAKGFEVVDAEDGLIGLELARSCGPQLVLVDINIPGLDGYEVVTRLRGEAHLGGVPIIAITAEGDRARALALGFDGFIPKPIKIATFGRELDAFLGGRREEAEGDRAAHIEAHSRQVVDHLEVKVRELTRANEQLRDVDRLKMEVLRNVSHELATPLTPLMGYARLLGGGELGPVSTKQKAVIERMEGSLRRLKGLIDNLLNVTRFATGAVSLERSVCTPSTLVEAALDAARLPAERRGTQLIVRGGASAERIVGDRGRLVEALKQLLDNAIKFGPEGGQVFIETRMLVEGHGDERTVEFSVADQGPGIPEAERGKVVEPFYQIDGSATRQHGGAGLGLAVVERIAALHGGKLVIKTASAGGALVALRVPARPGRSG